MLLQVGRQLFGNTIKRLASSASSPFKMSGEAVGTGLTNVVAALEEFAPNRLAERWDNTGLLVEPYTQRNITKILLTNDLTEDVALEANENGCEMIVSYHPPIFAPMKSVIRSAWKERIVGFLLENRIALYSPHTSWDAVGGGVNDWLASAFPFLKSEPLVPGEGPDIGAGRFLNLQPSISLSDAVARVKELTGLPHVRIAIARGKSMNNLVGTVAICAGSGASVLKGVEANLYVTGEMLHHDILDAAQKGSSVILTNHSDSERGFLKVFSPQLRAWLDDKVDILVSTKDRDPLVTV